MRGHMPVHMPGHMGAPPGCGGRTHIGGWFTLLPSLSMTQTRAALRPTVLTALLAALLSVLLTPAALHSFGAAIETSAPVFVAEPQVLEQVTGFNFHRGCLALAYRPGDDIATGRFLQMDLCYFTIGRNRPGVQVLRSRTERAAASMTPTGGSTPVHRWKACAAWCTSIPTPSTARADIAGVST